MTPSEHLAKFHDTVAILVKAYFDGTLEHANCSACAVGNLIAAACGVPRLFNEKMFDGRVRYFDIDESWYAGEGNLRMTSGATQTGYSILELTAIEHAFEGRDNFGADWSFGKDERQFKSLMAVVSVLASIHGVDLETTEAARKMFVKA